MKLFWIFTLLGQLAVADQMVDNSGFDLKLTEKLNQVLKNNDLEFRLVDQTGSGVSLSDYSGKKELLITSIMPECDNKKIVEASHKLSKNILFLNPVEATNRDEQTKNFPKETILMDENQQVSLSLQFTHAGDYVVIDPATQKVLKAGNLLGKKNKKSCNIPYVTYVQGNFYKEVLPALKSACLNCHTNTKNLDYFQTMDSIQSWKQMMLRTIRLRRMPPGADPYYSHLVTHSAQDITTITKWLESGPVIEDGIKEEYDRMIKGRVKTNPAVVKDRVIQPVILFDLPPEKVSASGSDFYKHYTTDTPTTQDYYATSFFFDINDNVAHHVALHYSKKPFPKVDLKGNPIDTPGTMLLYGNNPERITGTYKNKIIPGYKFRDPNIIHLSRSKGLQQSPRGTNYFIPKGSYLNLEIHYNPSGKDEESKNILTIFHDESLKDRPKIKRFSMMPNDGTIIAAPFEKDSVVSMSYKLTEDIDLLGYGLHMHYRARSGKVYAQRPDEKTKTLIFSIPTYQYKIQVTSILETPIPLPKGTVITHEMHYDNSKENLSNPAPEKAIKIGTSVLNDENYLPRFIYVEKK